MSLNWNWTKHVVNWLFFPFIIMATVWVVIVSLVIHVVTITIVIIIIVRWPCIVATLHWAGGPCMWKEVFRSFWEWVILVSPFLRRQIKECTNLGGACLISSPRCSNALYLVLEQWGSNQKTGFLGIETLGCTNCKTWLLIRVYMRFACNPCLSGRVELFLLLNTVRVMSCVEMNGVDCLSQGYDLVSSKHSHLPWCRDAMYAKNGRTQADHVQKLFQ